MSPAPRPRGPARTTLAAALGAAVAGAGVFALSACGPQAEPGYLGEPLVTLTARVADSPVAQALPLEGAVFWQRGAPPSTSGQVLAARAPLEPGLAAGAAASFTVRLYQPPPGEALQRLAPGEPAFARVTAAVVPFGITAPAAGALGDPVAPGTPTSQAYGIDPEHWLLFLAGEARPGSLTAWWLGAPLPAGWHVVKVAPVDPACLDAAALDACARDVAATGLVDTDVPTPGSPRAFCLAPYRLSVPATAELLVKPGVVGLPTAPAGCP